VQASQIKKRLIVLAGPCGTGKSTVAASLSKALGISWIEGDHLHSKMSIDKMSNCVALSDNDRWVWLETLKATALLDFNKNDSEQVIVTCSALKRIYRDELRNSRVMKPVFLMLQCDDQTLERRVSEREGHYMGVQMIGSQLQSLELPWNDEVDVIPVDAIGSQEDVLAEVLDVLESL
jgi:carbohydrate kinase (thermoresistant glucokinase family)